MSKYYPELGEKIVVALRKGMSRQAAAGIAGVTPGTLNKWMADGEIVAEQMEPADTDVGLLEFYLQALAAESAIEEVMVESWTGEAAENWQAAMHYLSRRFPSRWASQQRVDPDASKKNDERVQVNVYLPDNNRE